MTVLPTRGTLLRSCLGAAALMAALAGDATAQQVNYQFSPAPIAYPFFEPKRTDIKLTGVYAGLTGPGVALKAGGMIVTARHAFSEAFALDGQAGLGAINGTVPGFALPYMTNVLWTPVIEGEGKLSGITLPMSANIELQLVRRPRGSLIFFAGPNMVITPITIKTPYHVKNGGTNAKSTTFTTKATAVLAGVQAGVQAGIPLKAFQLVPYAMANMESGSASFTFDSGYSGGIEPITDGVVDIQSFSFYTLGADIIYTPWNLSLGTLLQQAKTNKTQNGYKLVSFLLSWHFRPS